MKHHGWIILDKPLGLGSTQAVGAVKRNLREAGLLGKGKDKLKVGHGGTLDPLATGVLPIALGEATKLCGRMLDASKIYDFTIQFGTETETLDSEGEVSETSDARPSLEQIEAILADFTGPIDQIPPKYSALKIDGKRAYDLARAGVNVEMKMRSVTIFELSVVMPFDNGSDEADPSPHVSKPSNRGSMTSHHESMTSHPVSKPRHPDLSPRHPELDSGSNQGAGVILKQVQHDAEDKLQHDAEDKTLRPVQHDEMQKPSVRPVLVEGRDNVYALTQLAREELIDGDDILESITLSAHVSKGTYIRSLARDIARAVGTVGHVTMLRRTKAGPFTLRDAISLDKLNEIGQGAALRDIILPMETALDDTPALFFTPEQAKAIQQGRVLTGIEGADGRYSNGQYLARDNNNIPLALVDLQNGTIKVIRGFNI